MKRKAASPVDSSTAVKKQDTSCAGWRAQGDKVECNCDDLIGDCMVFKSFSAACRHYQFPGSYQVGSYGPKGAGIMRTYSNATPGKDIVLEAGALFLYRLKDEAVRSQFKINMQRQCNVRVFRKVSAGVADLGLFSVQGFIDAGPGDQVEKFGKEFVQFVWRES
eukprot:gnl/TRDRNA2_/TRDRNA2_141362_c0_seq1.p1 gnl/TRDRNA2_/TRDRNA2_141362_c0~~gnl/TRDRNA2_/TRDRNA2_141362_c0_seq1.p1  ORF type:complete len:164 (-),score=24.73 gnl/TRDRNA2_/TRDRNA2_141362_c0_seq1:74-565(-)